MTETIDMNRAKEKHVIDQTHLPTPYKTEVDGKNSNILSTGVVNDGRSYLSLKETTFTWRYHLCNDCSKTLIR